MATGCLLRWAGAPSDFHRRPVLEAESGGTSLAFPRQVAYGAGKFVAVGLIDFIQGGLITSSDGILWRQPLLPTQNPLQSVIFANDLFVVGGINGPLMTSPNGETWTIRDTEVSAWRAFTYGNDTFLALGSAGVVSVATSTDGLIWRPGGIPRRKFHLLALLPAKVCSSRSIKLFDSLPLSVAVAF